MENKQKQDNRSRNWTFIIYPESAPDDWRETLIHTGEKWIESPLHDKDVNESDNSPKKPHWHIVMTFDNKKSFNQVKELTDKLNSPIPKIVRDLKNMVQYLWHRNNPEKYQYDKSEVVAYNGFKYRQYLTDIGVDTDVILQEIVAWIRETGCTEYAELVDYSVTEKFDDWFQVVRSQTIFLTAYLRSNRHKSRNIDYETGEIK